MTNKVIGIDPFGIPRVRASGGTFDEAYYNCREKIAVYTAASCIQNLLGTWKVEEEKEDAREV